MNKVRLLLSLVILASVTISGNSAAEEPANWFNSSNDAWKSGFGLCWESAFPGTQAEECGGAPPMAEPEMTGHFWIDDQDYDGVRDVNDKCPFTPEGVAVNSDGCATDNDGDGVPDYLDKCPETPLGSVVDTDGCARILVTLQNVHFAFDSASLTNEAKSILNAAVSRINANPSDTISIEGHTDSTGSDAYNSQLSQRRARSVAEYLASKGVSASRLKTIGKGESDPIASNDTREGRAKNRRVEVIAK